MMIAVAGSPGLYFGLTLSGTQGIGIVARGAVASNRRDYSWSTCHLLRLSPGSPLSPNLHPACSHSSRNLCSNSGGHRSLPMCSSHGSFSPPRCEILRPTVQRGYSHAHCVQLPVQL